MQNNFSNGFLHNVINDDSIPYFDANDLDLEESSVSSSNLPPTPTRRTKITDGYYVRDKRSNCMDGGLEDPSEDDTSYSSTSEKHTLRRKSTIGEHLPNDPT
ncbi:hypothetical protein Ciccas_008639 [Cichlidogyrus casuarinus]|uniref:Uncharacterized protein n=1 Tax=Cichlidogyrus casuarinus TaxID=1844966 RepID=A0ABD2Q212_9PLAT